MPTIQNLLDADTLAKKIKENAELVQEIRETLDNNGYFLQRLAQNEKNSKSPLDQAALKTLKQNIQDLQKNIKNL